MSDLDHNLVKISGLQLSAMIQLHNAIYTLICGHSSQSHAHATVVTTPLSANKISTGKIIGLKFCTEFLRVSIVLSLRVAIVIDTMPVSNL